jgi:hypothetical protein
MIHPARKLKKCRVSANELTIPPSLNLPHPSPSPPSTTSCPCSRSPTPRSQSLIIPKHRRIPQHIRNHKKPHMTPPNINMFQMTHSTISCRHRHIPQLHITVILRYINALALRTRKERVGGRMSRRGGERVEGYLLGVFLCRLGRL